MTSEELKALLNQAPRRPCDVQDMAKKITIINNVIEEIINNGGAGSIIARCTLTNPTMDCVHSPLEVGDFTPYWDETKWGPFPYPTPEEAINIGNFACVGGAKIGWIGLNHAGNQWEVLKLEEALFTWVTEIEQTGNTSFHWLTGAGTAHSCDAAGAFDFTIETETEDVFTNLRQDGCSLEAELTTVGVLSSAVVGYTTVVTFSDVVNVLTDVYFSGCAVYGYYTPLTVPCSGIPFADPVPLFYASDICLCCDEEGSGSGEEETECCEDPPEELVGTVVDQEGEPSTVYTIGPLTLSGGNHWEGDLFCDGAVAGSITLDCSGGHWTGTHTSAAGGDLVSAQCDPFSVIMRFTFVSFPSICGFTTDEWVEIEFTAAP